MQINPFHTSEEAECSGSTWHHDDLFSIWARSTQTGFTVSLNHRLSCPAQIRSVKSSGWTKHMQSQNFFLSKDTDSFLKNASFHGSFEDKEAKPRQPAHSGEMKFLQVQEPPNCPGAKGCVMRNSPLLVLQLLTLFWSALLYFPHCFLDPRCPRTHLLVLLLKTRAGKKAKNLLYWTACYGFDWEIQHPKMSYWLNCHPWNVCSWRQTKNAFECA